MMPTIKQVIQYYQIISQAERMKSGRPGVATVNNAVWGAQLVCRAAGIPLEASVDRLTRRALDMALVTFLQQGHARISAWSYVCQLRAVFAKWTHAYYEDCGWEIPPLALPVFHANPPRYVRPSFDALRNVKSWYQQLEREAFAQRAESPTAESAVHSRRYLNDHAKEREWLAVTLMLEFAMRNGDILRLTPANFIVRELKEGGDTSEGAVSESVVRHFLFYTPHKTALSSRRQVCWPIHPDIWARLGPLVTDGDKPESALLRTLDSGVFERINRAMRRLGFRGGKGAYELRKICVDHVYQKFGAERATAISGDDIKTVTRYYADPSAVTVVGIRIVDLL